MTVSEYCEPGLLDKLLNYRYYAVTPFFLFIYTLQLRAPICRSGPGCSRCPPPFEPHVVPSELPGHFCSKCLRGSYADGRESVLTFQQVATPSCRDSHSIAIMR